MTARPEFKPRTRTLARVYPLGTGELARGDQRPAGMAPSWVVDGLLVPRREAGRRRSGWRLRAVVAWLVGLGLAAGLVWLLVQAVLALVAALLVLAALVVAWVQTNWVWIVLAVGLLGWLLTRLGAASSCAGLHCGGCRR